MIPAIGLMIWAYCMARLIEMLNRTGERKPSHRVTVFAVLMICVLCGGCVGMVIRSATTP
jgi:hypothetical protein